MSKLDDLINELCPDGVEYVKIKDRFQRLKGTPITATKMKEIDNFDGEIKIFAGGKTVINAKEKDIPKANITRVPAVLVQSRGIIGVVYYDKPFTFKNEMWAYTADSITEVKFLYYVLKNNIEKFREEASGMGSLPQISLKVTEEFKIPVPHIEVQREIVRILDNFTNYTDCLEKEIELRKKQYEYYRDMLLNFDDSVEWNTLGEVCIIKNGRDYKSFGSGGIPVYGSGGIIAYTSKFAFDKPSVLIPRKGSINKLYYIDEPFWNVDTIFYTDINTTKVIPKYLYYYLSKEHLEQYNTAGGVPSLTQKVLNNIKIPVPPIEEQERIVKILDRFDSLCNDLTNGIPAEISARKKQYEFYRDKLLQFRIKKA